MGIKVSSSFDQQGAIPLDSRTVVDSVTDLYSIPKGVRYVGLTVYVKATEELYILTGGTEDSNWSKLLANLNATTLEGKDLTYFAPKEYVDSIVQTKVPENAVFTDTVVHSLSELDDDIGVLTNEDIGSKVEKIDPNITRMGSTFNKPLSLLQLLEDGNLPDIQGVNILKTIKTIQTDMVYKHKQYVLDGGTY